MSNQPSRFYGGDASAMGRARKLSPSSWAKFVQETLGHPVLVNVTREQFHALPAEEQRARKRVQFVTPATFKTTPAQRVFENADGIAFVALDIDDSRQARPFDAEPPLMREALEPLAFASYRTASSRPEAPKLRIMVACGPDIPVTRYGDAVRAVAARLGLATITKESLVAVQPMYLPTLFRDDDPVEDHPLLIAVTEGAALSLADLEDVDEILSVGTASGAPKPDASGGTDDDMDHLRPTLDGIEIHDAAAALEHLDPDCSYPEWLEVAAALRHQFHGVNETKAYELFDKWSAKGSKYSNQDDTQAKWKSLRASPRGRAPVTIRSLFHKAAEAGWVSTGVGAKVHSTVLGWLSHPQRTSAELLEHGLKRIAGAPLQNPLDRASLVNRLRTELASRHCKVSVADLKKELRRLDHRTAKPSPHTPENELPKWARGVCYVAGANEFYFRSADRKLGPEVLDNVYGVHLMEGDSVSGRPAVRPRDFLLNVSRVPRVDHYAYDPSHPEESFITVGKRRFVNLYVPTYPEADEADMDLAGDAVLTHMSRLVAEPAYRRTILDFMAYCVQYPGQKIRWALLLQGAQGCGKTALAEIMAAVLGRNHVNMLDASKLFSDFNTWAADSQIVAVEEIRVVGHNRHEVMDRLKPCISNDTVTVNGKHKDLRINVPNVTNYFMFTNHRDSLAVSSDDRRYFVVNSQIQTKDQVAGFGPDYFRKLFGIIHGKAAGLRAFFEQWGISGDFDAHGHAPTTTYLGDLQSAASTPLQAAVSEAIADGDHPLVQTDLVSARALKAILDTEGLGNNVTDQHIGGVLRELKYFRVGRARVGERRHWLWTQAPTTLDKAQAMAVKRFEKVEEQ